MKIRLQVLQYRDLSLIGIKGGKLFRIVGTFLRIGISAGMLVWLGFWISSKSGSLDVKLG